MAQEKGNISISTENIFPIIKKWLYSDKDIFIRELISNSCDAISKLKKLAAIGEAVIPDDHKFFIRVVVNKDMKTISFIDNGIGMTDEEVKKYINQIAFSGVQDFVEKYRDNADGADIIGHFGIGFYSSFMVADKVVIDTRSYIAGEDAIRWESDGTSEYTMEPSDRTDVGTTVTIHTSSDGDEYYDEYKTREIITKYCNFIPYDLFYEFIDSEAKLKAEKEKEKSKGKKKEGAEAEAEPETETAEEPINDPNPLWMKNPKECTDEEYKEFYKKVFFDFNDPLFWIHINMDYPFNMKGILYFPKLKHEFEMNEGRIKLYYNQIFVADNIKEIIPEFLMLLKGTIDCPDLPLNVSRSFLQNDGYVAKISSHIIKKVSDKLVSIFEDNRPEYEKYWEDIHPFVKYGCMREQKFFDRVKDIVIYKTTNDDYTTLKDYLARNEDKHKNTVFYVTDVNQQAQYVKIFKEHGLEAVIMSTLIDSSFMQFIEMKESGVKFVGIDSDVAESLKHEDDMGKEEAESIGDLLKKLFRSALHDEKLSVRVEALKSEGVPGILTLSEQSKRMREFSKVYGGGNDFAANFPKEETLVVNRNNDLIKKLIEIGEDESRKADVDLICGHIYDLALMSHRQLSTEEMTRFIERSNTIMTKIL